MEMNNFLYRTMFPRDDMSVPSTHDPHEMSTMIAAV